MFNMLNATKPMSFFRNLHMQACNDFLAGNALRSSQRFHALDETAVFGCACKHEFPVLFLNLKHGERLLARIKFYLCRYILILMTFLIRLAYGVWLIEELTSQFPEAINPCVMYDVACSLVAHLKKNDNQLLEKVTFALPSFHAYGHKPACQVRPIVQIELTVMHMHMLCFQILYSPLRVEGIGLADGEVMERLWSYLRRFTRMTKEMRPAHRIDVLTHALLYYGITTKKKLGIIAIVCVYTMCD